MAIHFTKKKRRQNFLVIIFFIVLTVIVFILWQGFYKESIPIIYDDDVVLVPPREVKINFQALEKAVKFEKFIEIKPFAEIFSEEGELIGKKIGRENPFLNY